MSFHTHRTLSQRIQDILHQQGQIEGIHNLASTLDYGEHRTDVRHALRRLADAGKIIITPGAPGRGHKTIIRLAQ